MTKISQKYSPFSFLLPTSTIFFYTPSQLLVVNYGIGIPQWLRQLKRLSAVQETQVQSLGWEDALEKEMAAHSSTLAQKIPGMEEPGRLQCMGSQKSRTQLSDFILTQSQNMKGSPGGSDSKQPTLQFRRPGFSPWMGTIPWRRAWQTTPVPLPRESHGQRSLVGYIPWGRKRVGLDLVTKEQQQHGI